MTDLRQAAQQALETLEYASTGNRRPEIIGPAITALKAALEQQQAEPVAYYHPHKGFYWAKPTYISAPIVVDVPPVPLYVKWIAAQRPWQGLTKVQKDDFADAYGSYEAVCAIEQALKERNT